MNSIYKTIKKQIDNIFPDKKFRMARKWSNIELRKISGLFYGDIINVSGSDDNDKEGNKYSDYFINKKTYTISNYGGYRGFKSEQGELFIDLEKNFDKNLIQKFDVVFNHTTLEHVFDVFKAFDNLCLMSKDIVILVIPFLQEMHYSESFFDYWRFTPFAIKKMFEKNNFEIVYINANNNKKESIYLFVVASKKPNKWLNKLQKNDDVFIKLGQKII